MGPCPGGAIVSADSEAGVLTFSIPFLLFWLMMTVSSYF
jgi:hypothetical protein